MSNHLPADLERLIAVIKAQPAAATNDQTLAAIAAELRQRYGDSLDAVVVYGSYLRGKRDTLLDCYVLLDHNARRVLGNWHWWLQRLLPPNVYYLSRTELGVDAHAKYATIGTEQLHRAIKHDCHSYFWSRFAQPCALLYARDSECAAVVQQLRATAARRCLQEARQLSGQNTDALSRWTALFRQTYQAELRSESPERALELIAADAAYYQVLDNAWHNAAPDQATSAASSDALWRRRRWLGKTLSLLRLIKASVTFTDGLDYLLWKVERHSGVRLTATERARRYPLLFAWPLVWRAWRAGGFR